VKEKKKKRRRRRRRRKRKKKKITRKPNACKTLKRKTKQTIYF
jgi:hypothetical protein